MAKLELRELGNMGLKLSCVGFGASPLGNVFDTVSEEEANASVREAFRLGINFFDTSPYVSIYLFFFFPPFLKLHSISFFFVCVRLCLVLPRKMWES